MIYVQIYSPDSGWHALRSAVHGGRIVTLCADGCGYNIGVWIRTDEPNRRDMCPACLHELGRLDVTTAEIDPNVLRASLDDDERLEIHDLDDAEDVGGEV